jgi:hypothetical protein
MPAGAYFLAKRRAWAPLALLGLSFGAGIAGIGWYDRALSGSARTLPWYLQCAIEHYGFGRVWKYDTFEHTPWTGLENLAVVAVRLNAWWLGFPLSLGVLALVPWLKPKFRDERLWLGVALAIVLFEFAYYSPGCSDTGSLYHHELVLPGSLVAAAVAEAGFARVPALTATALGVHLAFGTLSFLGEQTLRLARLIHTIHADSDAALARIEGPALLFYELRGSERRAAGWVFEAFPARFRGKSDRIVTFPNVPAAHRARILAEYPGRACWYYRREPFTEAAELLRCDAARKLMDRTIGDDDKLPLWIQPTAYRVTSFDPLASNSKRHARDAQGRIILTCCGLRELRELGVPVDATHLEHCVADGP